MNNIRKILCMGLSTAGKSTLCKELSKQLKAVWWDADVIRKQIGDDLGFSHEDRIIQAKRMGWLCNQVNEAGHFSVASFICPTSKTRQAFGINEQTFVIYMKTIKPEACPFHDTAVMFEEPNYYDMIFTEWYNPSKMAEDVIRELNYAQVKDRKNFII